MLFNKETQIRCDSDLETSRNATLMDNTVIRSPSEVAESNVNYTSMRSVRKASD